MDQLHAQIKHEKTEDFKIIGQMLSNVDSTLSAIDEWMKDEDNHKTHRHFGVLVESENLQEEWSQTISELKAMQLFFYNQYVEEDDDPPKSTTN